MTALGAGLAAQEDGLLFKRTPVEYSGHVAFPHQGEELPLIAGPRATRLPIAVEQCLAGRKAGVVHVADAAQRIEKVRQVGRLGEAGELGDVVQPDVEQPRYASGSEPPEEMLG